MKCRPVSENGDWQPIWRSSQMLTEQEAVSRAIKSRLDLLYGEWWENETLGFQVPRFLIDGLRGGQTTQALIGYIVAYILATPGVTTLAASDYTQRGRSLTANVSVNTEFGQQVDWSVDINELLSTLP